MAASVLVVDDDPDIRGALQLLLTQAGFDVSLANNGREALRQVQAARPDLIVLDLMMPEMDGWEFLAAARPVAPVIVISGAGQFTHRPLPGNVVRLISKPFDIERFLAVVEKYCPTAARSPIVHH